ncbi:hypothetical protein FGB62_24g153 [Gracilaria domingensis]|nr:hypothetical protein FGB62_24g153 [Gracilaria domingensis]
MNVNGYGNVSEIEKEPQEIERLRAMLDFAKNVEPEAYIDYDLYGRGDSRVFSEITSSGGGRSKTRMQSVKDTEEHHATNTWFVPLSSLGNMFRSVLRKLTKTMDCFGQDISIIDVTTDNTPLVVEVTRPKAVASLPSSFEDRPEPPRNKSFVDGDKSAAIEAPRKVFEKNNVEQVEAVDTQNEEDVQNIVDDTPRRVKSRVDSGDDLSVVEKGTIVRTLTKLRSTGSFVFKETRSLVSQNEDRNDGDFDADKTSCLFSNDSAEAVQDSGAQSSRDETRSQESSLIHPEIFRPCSDNAARVKEHDVLVEEANLVEAAHIAAKNGVSAGNVTRLRSVFEEDTSGVVDAVLVYQLEDKQERMSAKYSTPCDKPCGQSSIGSENEKKDELQNGNNDDAIDLQHASSTPMLSGTVTMVRSSMDADKCHVPDNVIIHKVSCTPRVSAITVRPESLTTKMKCTSEFHNWETAPDTEGVEQPPLLSAQELSKHLSGRVQKIKSLFESSSVERASDEFGMESKSEEAHRIRSGLSCDSGVFSHEDDENVDKVVVETQITVESATGKEMSPKTINATEATRVFEEDDKQDQNMATIQVVEDSVVMREDILPNSGEEVMEMSALVEEDDSRTEHKIQSHRNSGESLPDVVVDESSSDSGSSYDDIFHPVSHLVGSCLIM